MEYDVFQLRWMESYGLVDSRQFGKGKISFGAEKLRKMKAKAETG